jgi:Arc/MetJ-type ribon-helix-helix transcriptional regulator
MNTPLTPKVEQLIAERLQSGAYRSATDVVEDAFEALVERENFLAIRREMDHADEQLVNGEYTDYDENTMQSLAEDVITRAQARLAEERKNSAR